MLQYMNATCGVFDLPLYGEASVNVQPTASRLRRHHYNLFGAEKRETVDPRNDAHRFSITPPHLWRGVLLQDTKSRFNAWQLGNATMTKEIRESDEVQGLSVCS